MACDHDWSLPPGSIIPFHGREMKALIGENMMPLFWKCREFHINIRASRGGDGEHS